MTTDQIDRLLSAAQEIVRDNEANYDLRYENGTVAIAESNVRALAAIVKEISSDAYDGFDNGSE